MDLSQEPSKDEARTMDRQLYRAGQTPKTPKPSPAAPARSIAKPSAPQSKRSLAKGDSTPFLQRRLVRGILALLWLLLLGGASYCVFLPDPIEEARRDMRDLWRNKDLTREERREKMGQIVSGLSDRQRRDFFISPERRVKIHDDMDTFFKLSPAEQAAQLKKEILEREKWRAEFEKKRKEWDAQRKANGGANRGAQAKGGGSGRGGPGWGGRGGGGDDPTGGDMFPPETRQQMGLKRDMSRDMSKQMGITNGRGRNGGPGGGRGRPTQ